MTTAADEFFSGGLPSASFPVLGTVVEGTITRIGEPMPAKKFKSQEIDRWPDGQPKMVLPVDLQTDLRDPSKPGDNGLRTLWIKGYMKDAIQAALTACGYGTKLRVGGRLAVAFVREEENGTPNPTKHYEARYTPPANAAAESFFGAQPAAAAAPAPSAPAPAPAQPAAPIQAPAAFGQIPGQAAWPPAPAVPTAHAPAQPAAAPVQLPAQPAATTGPDLSAWFETAYSHLDETQKAAVRAAGLDPAGAAGLAPAQLAQAFGAPSIPAPAVS